MVHIIGVDISKSYFHCCALGEHGELLWRKKVTRCKVLDFFTQHPSTKVALESCGGSQYWARELMALGHTAILIHAQHVKPFLRKQKNDFNDAQAIAEAALRKEMPKVSVKTEHQQELQFVHRQRSGYIRMRTATINEMRGFLMEFGYVFSKSRRRFLTQLRALLSQQEKLNDRLLMHLILKSLQTLESLDASIAWCEQLLQSQSKDLEICRKIQKIKGIGLLTATAIAATVGDFSEFKNGRHFAAYLGLVPKQHSTGGKAQLGRISKRGNVYLRSLLVQGAHAVLNVAEKSKDRLSVWLTQLMQRRGRNKAAIALANKNARIICAIMKSGQEYRPAA